MVVEPLTVLLQPNLILMVDVLTHHFRPAKRLVGPTLRKFIFRNRSREIFLISIQAPPIRSEGREKSLHPQTVIDCIRFQPQPLIN